MRSRYPFPWTREALADYVMNMLNGERLLSEAHAAIKRGREGRVDPEWEGTTADQHEEELRMIEALIADIKAVL